MVIGSSPGIFTASSVLNAGEVQCEQPNNSLYTFTGNLIINKQTVPLSPNQLLLRVWNQVSLPSLLYRVTFLLVVH